MGRILSPSNGASKLSAPSIPHRQLSMSKQNYSRNPKYIYYRQLYIDICNALQMGGWPTAFIVSFTFHSVLDFLNFR